MSGTIVRTTTALQRDFDLKLPNDNRQLTLSSITELQETLSNIIERVANRDRLLPVDQRGKSKDNVWIQEATRKLTAAFQNVVTSTEHDLLKDNESYKKALDRVRDDVTVKEERVRFKPSDLGMVVQNNELPIFYKIIRSIVSLPCGFAEFSDYAGGEAYERFFKTFVSNRFEYDRFADNHSKDVVSLILYGPPGTGKTFMAEAVAGYLRKSGYNATLMAVSSSTIKGPYVGESEKAMKFLFEVARGIIRLTDTPLVLFFDEIDGLIQQSPGGNSEGLLSEFNTQTQGVGVNNTNLISIAATNYPDRIRMAAFDRFRYKLYVGHPDRSTIREILLNRMKSFGKTQFNFIHPKYPVWMQRIDWDRKQFILDFVGDTMDGADFGKPGQRVSLKLPTSIAKFRNLPDNDQASDRIRNANNNALNNAQQSIFYGELDNWHKDSKMTRFGYPNKSTYLNWMATRHSKGMDGQNLVYDNLFTNGHEEKVPWDFLDYFVHILHANHYTPRVMETIWYNILARAEQRSVEFSKDMRGQDTLYQKWILEQSPVKRKQITDDTCTISEMTVWRMIPLYNFDPKEAKAVNGLSEENQIIDQLSKYKMDGVLHGTVVERNVNTFKDGKVVPSTGSKLYGPEKKGGKFARVVVIETSQTTDKNGTKYKRRMIEASDYSGKGIKSKDVSMKGDEINNVFPYTIVETEPGHMKNIARDIPSFSDSQFSVQTFVNVLGSSQLTIQDYLDAIKSIKPGKLENIGEFLEYAKISSNIDGYDIVENSITHLEALARKKGVNVAPKRMARVGGF